MRFKMTKIMMIMVLIFGIGSCGKKEPDYGDLYEFDVEVERQLEEIKGMIDKSLMYVINEVCEDGV
jgi:hypothetical protein